ncbi:MAG: hypothetical protein JWM39_142 [Parcubacteria group bacterium]|nr:hypothetical protein [Parcubacteria group bacterium]
MSRIKDILSYPLACPLRCPLRAYDTGRARRHKSCEGTAELVSAVPLEIFVPYQALNMYGN